MKHKHSFGRWQIEKKRPIQFRKCADCGKLQQKVVPLSDATYKYRSMTQAEFEAVQHRLNVIRAEREQLAQSLGIKVGRL